MPEIEALAAGMKVYLEYQWMSLRNVAKPVVVKDIYPKIESMRWKTIPKSTPL
jgi:hypothetical protein